MYTGTVKFFNPEKGFGFIKKDSGGDIFVHHTGIQSGTVLTENLKVQFETEPSPKGDRAINVRPA